VKVVTILEPFVAARWHCVAKDTKGITPAMDKINPSNLVNQASAEARRILVVDDEPVMLKAVRRALMDAVRHSSRAGCSVDVAETAEDALTLATTHRYHAVITDYEMPDRNGVWLLEKLKEQCPDTFRVLHSGSNPRGLGAHIACGVIQQFIPKPASSGELAALWG
jgi:CheY-like chemotaxis protein